MSVDTYLKGKNLSQYRTVRRDGIKVLLSPKLYGFADLIEFNLKGRVRPKLHAVINRAADSC